MPSMIYLTRQVRFALIDERQRPFDWKGPVDNSWSGWPPLRGLSPFLTLACTLGGRPNRNSGYLCNIKEIDQLVRKRVIPSLARQATEDPVPLSGEGAIQIAWNLIEPETPAGTRLEQLCLGISPFLSYCVSRGHKAMVQITKQFEFSASHRLHNSQLSDAENRDLFGKCNNPSGHGHNYIVEVTLLGSTTSGNSVVIEPERFEQVVRTTVVDRLDHKHLNRDVEHFKKVIPSVENITIAIWDWLKDKFESAKLHKVKVFETPKTWAEYHGEKAD